MKPLTYTFPKVTQVKNPVKPSKMLAIKGDIFFCAQINIQLQIIITSIGHLNTRGN